MTSAEDHFLEHKQTLRYDVQTKQANPKMADAVMDRICGFWNAYGGTLLIGVEDRTGIVTGLAPDLKLVRDLDARRCSSTTPLTSRASWSSSKVRRKPVLASRIRYAKRG